MRLKAMHPRLVCWKGSGRSILLRGGLLAAVFMTLVLQAGTIVGSKHDLSVRTNPESSSVCMYCHTPHNANDTLGTANVPLWNRFVDQKKVYTVFTSASMSTVPGSPSQSMSAVCLGCHDGSVGFATVHQSYGSDKMNLLNVHSGAQQGGRCGACHPDWTSNPDTADYSTIRDALNLGMNLSRMHPVSMSYPTASQDSAFNRPPDGAKGWSDVKLYGGKVECGSCHQPHDPSIAPFLRRTADAGELCLVCHIK